MPTLSLIVDYEFGAQCYVYLLLVIEKGEEAKWANVVTGVDVLMGCLLLMLLIGLCANPTGILYSLTAHIGVFEFINDADDINDDDSDDDDGGGGSVGNNDEVDKIGDCICVTLLYLLEMF